MPSYELTTADYERLRPLYAAASSVEAYRQALGGKLPCEETGQTEEESLVAAKAYATRNQNTSWYTRMSYLQYIELVCGRGLDPPPHTHRIDALVFAYEAELHDPTPEMIYQCCNACRTQEDVAYLGRFLVGPVKRNLYTRITQPYAYDNTLPLWMEEVWFRPARELGRLAQAGFFRSSANPLHRMLGRDVMQHLAQFVASR